MKFHDPRAKVAVENDPYNLSVDVRANGGSGVTVGLLANGFPDSELFVAKLGEVLQERFPEIKTRLWNKGNPAISAGEEILAEIKADCQAAIAAYGH